jgi:hypothetical protein
MIKCTQSIHFKKIFLLFFFFSAEAAENFCRIKSIQLHYFWDSEVLLNIIGKNNAKYLINFKNKYNKK